MVWPKVITLRDIYCNCILEEVASSNMMFNNKGDFFDVFCKMLFYLKTEIDLMQNGYHVNLYLHNLSSMQFFKVFSETNLQPGKCLIHIKGKILFSCFFVLFLFCFILFCFCFCFCFVFKV
jgi:hypothetical protein